MLRPGHTTNCFHRRHVKIVDEHEHLLTRGWSEQVFALLFQLRLHDVFKICRLRLSAISHTEAHVIIGPAHFIEKPLHNYTFPDACFSHEKDVESVLH